MAVNILIVEDEFIISQDLEDTLLNLGYHVEVIASNYKDALLALEAKKIDIALLDVNLNDEKDGIDIATYIKEKINIPFIFITSNADKNTVERAKETTPNGYIVKPFNKDSIYTTIEMALSNYVAKIKKSDTEPTIIIKDGTTKFQLNWKDILFVKSEGNYIAIVTENKKHLIRNSLKDFSATIPFKHFIKIHKSYIVNTNYLKAIHSAYININEHEIPIGREFKEAFLLFINQNKQQL